jgi:hypothetical protein
MNRTGKGNVARSFAREGHKVHFRVLTPNTETPFPAATSRRRSPARTSRKRSCYVPTGACGERKATLSCRRQSTPDACGLGKTIAVEGGAASSCRAPLPSGAARRNRFRACLAAAGAAPAPAPSPEPSAARSRHISPCGSVPCEGAPHRLRPAWAWVGAST